jgi:hypothetical protein
MLIFFYFSIAPASDSRNREPPEQPELTQNLSFAKATESESHAYSRIIYFDCCAKELLP